MKRDMGLMRKILFYIEDNYNPRSGIVRHFLIDGIDKRIILEHIKLLEDKGLVRKIDRNRSTYGSGNLTDAGYDYLELIRSDDVWKKTNEEVEKKKLPLTIESIAKIAGIFIGNVIDQVTPK